jgi:nucleotide-binding universal stress UspA family protein
MSALISRLDRGRRLISRVVLHGPPAATVLGYTDQLSVDLVVIGRRDEARATEKRQMTHRLLSDLGSDLLLVPTLSYPTLPNAA